MGTVNTSVVIAVFILIIILSLIIAIMINPGEFDKSRCRTFLVTAASLGIVITFMWYFFLVEQTVDNDKLIQCNEHRHIGSMMLNASVDKIQDSVDIIPEFCSSLLPLQDNSGCNNVNEHSQIKRDVTTATLSYTLFDTWEHYVGSVYRPQGIVAYFLQWSTSKQLRDQWSRQYINFDCKTQKFAQILFDKSDQMEDIHNPYQYQIDANEIIRDCKRLKIFK